MRCTVPAKDHLLARPGRLFLFLGLLVLLSVGCTITLRDQKDLARLTAKQGLGAVYYIGSEGRFDYFASKFLMEGTKFYRLRQEESPLRNRFAKTNDVSKWEPYQIDLGLGVEGFRDEEKHSIR